MVNVQVQQMLAYSRLLGLDATTQPQRVLILAIVSKRLFFHRTGLFILIHLEVQTALPEHL